MKSRLFAAIAVTALVAGMGIEALPASAGSAKGGSVSLSDAYADPATHGNGSLHAGRRSETHIARAGTSKRDLRTLPKAKLVRRERAETAPPLNPNWANFSGDSTNRAGVTATAAPAPASTNSFDGLDYQNWGQGHPGDDNGDVGPTYYIQTINSSIGIYRKSDGVRVAAFTFNTFMSQGHFGNRCDTDNFGDPVVMYDSFEDRWVVTDFAFQLDSAGNVVNPPGSFECIAVSQSGDPVTGGWNFYSVNTAGGMGDYPKLGIWPDGIYMSVNMFNYVGSGYQNPRVYAFNKAQMYAGAASAQVVSFDAPSSDFTLIPSNARLQTGTPPSGSPAYFLSTWNYLNAVTVYDFHVDWSRPSLSTFTGPFNSGSATSWPSASPGTAQTPANSLDTVGIRAMVQNQYSNIGGVESLWAAHTVDRASTTGWATPRYYQVGVSNGTVAQNVTQAATWDPDNGVNTTYRYMPSVDVDRMGDMAMGYTTSNATTNPGIAYAGRLFNDPLNTFSQTETMLYQGGGSQSGNCGGAACTRWGDYTAMSLDPDGCTFWYTNQYYPSNGLNFNTRIGSFAFPGCTTVGSGALSGTVTASPAGTPLAGATVRLGSRTTTTGSDGSYSFPSLPAGTYPSLSVADNGYVSDSAANVAVSEAATTTRDFSLSAAPTSGSFVDTTKSDFLAGTPAGTTAQTVDGDVVLAPVVGVDQRSEPTLSAVLTVSPTQWASQTFTAGTTGSLTKVDMHMTCSSCTSGSQPSLSVSIRATSGGVPTGPDLGSGTIPGFNSPADTVATAVLSTPVSVTAGSQYAILVRSTAPQPSPGRYQFYVSSAIAPDGPYAGGMFLGSTNSGSTWNAFATRDGAFHTYVDTGYPSSGTFTSAAKDSNPLAGGTPMWGALSWTADTPAGTGVSVQVGASDSAGGPFSFVGPDGTTGTTFNNGDSLSQFNGHRYLQYRARLTTTSNTLTPALHDVSVGFATAASQTITFTGAPSSATYGDVFSVAASSTSGLPVTVTSSGACTNDGDTVTMTSGTGTCSLTASQPGNSAYSPAPAAYQSTAATKADQTVALTVPATATYGDAPIAVSGAVTPSGLLVTLGATGPCSYAAGNVSISGAGTCTVTGDQAGDDNYNAAPQATADISIGKADQTITFDELSNATYGDGPIALTATSSSLLPVSYVATGDCSVADATLTLTGAGDCTVTASQAGDDDYNAASDVVRAFSIGQATATLSVTDLTQTYDGSPKPATVTTDPAGLDGVTVTYDGSSTPPTAGGTYTVQATLTNANYAAAPVTETLTIAAAPQSIDFAALPAATFGDPAFQVSATATSGLPVSFSVGSTDNCTISGQTVTLTGAGSCTVTATQAGDNSWQAADAVARTFTINPGSATLSLDNVSQTYNGSARPVTVLTSPAGLAGVAVTYDGSSTVPTNAGSYAVHATLTNANWTATPIDGTLVIAPAEQTITFAPLPTKSTTDPDFAVSATASSGLPVTFAATGNCTINVATVHITGPGSCTVTASQAGNNNYNAAPDVANTFAVNGASATLKVSNLTQVYTGAPRPITVTTNPVGLQTVTVTYNGLTTPPTNAGSYAVHVTLTNPTYSAAPIDSTLVVQQAKQTISFGPLSSRFYGSPDFVVSAQSSKGLPVSFAASGPCTVAGTLVHLTGGGLCTITASQPGNVNIAAATPVGRSFMVYPASTTTTVTASPKTVKRGAQVSLTASVSPATVAGSPVSGQVKFSIAGVNVGSAPLVNGVASLPHVTVNAGAGTAKVTATFSSATAGVNGSSGSTSLTVTR